MQNINVGVIVVVALAALALVIFLVNRNRRDQKKLLRPGTDNDVVSKQRMNQEREQDRI